MEYYTIGSQQWKTVESWPIPDRKEELFYLGSVESLLEVPEEDTAYDSYRYDPADEVPYLVDVSENEFGVPGNYVEVEQREDVLVFETQSFTAEKNITGDMGVEFFAGSDAPNKDSIVRQYRLRKTGFITEQIILPGLSCKQKYKRR